jgi:hypothetical protein
MTRTIRLFLALSILPPLARAAIGAAPLPNGKLEGSPTNSTLCPEHVVVASGSDSLAFLFPERLITFDRINRGRQITPDSGFTWNVSETTLKRKRGRMLLLQRSGSCSGWTSLGCRAGQVPIEYSAELSLDGTELTLNTYSSNYLGHHWQNDVWQPKLGEQRIQYGHETQEELDALMANPFYAGVEAQLLDCRYRQ